MLSRVTACSLTLALACSLAQATTWTFTDYTEDHKWNTALNWDDGQGHHQVPYDGDTAIIPSNKTCNIEADSDGGWVDYLTVNGTLTVSEDLDVDFDLTVGGTLTVYDNTRVQRKMIVNGSGTAVLKELLIVPAIDVYGTLELWPNSDEGTSLELGANGALKTHTLDGTIYFQDDNTGDADYPTLTCKSGGNKIEPSSAQEDGLITASAGDSCEPGIIDGC